MNFDESVAYMEGLLRFGEKYGNGRLEALLQRLGSPQRSVPVVHIAGTKGKGSTTTFAASMLSAAGYKTGAYLSPFVYDLRERIQIDGRMIPQEIFARWVTTIRPHVEVLAATEYGQITEFELKTAVAFCYFAEQRVDYAAVEVGLGGRLDATNVAEKPLVSVITNIGLDHVEILGDTLELIAAEKAGIIRENGLCVTAIEGGPALDTVRQICRERKARFVALKDGRDWYSDQDGTLTILTPKRRLAHVRLRMLGRFQHANAALALHAIDRARMPTLSDQAVRAGLENATAPGRMELIQADNPTVVADSAHNQMSGAVLANALVEEFHAANRPVVLVLGLSKRHDPEEMISALVPRIKPLALVATEPHFRPREAAEVAQCAEAAGVPLVEIIIPVASAARRAVEIAALHKDALVVVTGSFFTVGELPDSVWRGILGSRAV